jgi:predicted transcriptional regulator
LFHPHGEQSQQIHVAYRQYGYRLAEIADHLGVHAATVRRQLKETELDLRLQNLNTESLFSFRTAIVLLLAMWMTLVGKSAANAMSANQIRMKQQMVELSFFILPERQPQK